MSATLWTSPEVDGEGYWVVSRAKDERGVAFMVAVSRLGEMYVKPIVGDHVYQPPGAAQAVLSCHAFAQRLGGAR